MTAAEILTAVRALEVSTWRYEREPADVRHMGPMAQDFRAAFGLGDSDKTIWPVDAIGVLMVAVQELARRVEELEASDG